MPTDLISRADAVKALEEYAFEIAKCCSYNMAYFVFECLRIVKNLPAIETD